MDHARLVQRAVPEWLGVVVPHVAVGRYVRVLDGVDVDGQAVRVLRPRRAWAPRGDYRAAVEARRVVPIVVRVVVVGPVLHGQVHLVDPEPGIEQLPERRHHSTSDRPVHHHQTLVHLAVEPPIPEGQKAELPDGHGAPGVPGRASHLRLEVGREVRDRPLEPRRERRRAGVRGDACGHRLRTASPGGCLRESASRRPVGRGPSARREERDEPERAGSHEAADRPGTHGKYCSSTFVTAPPLTVSQYPENLPL